MAVPQNNNDVQENLRYLYQIPPQKTYEMSIGSESINVKLFGANRQLDWLKTSLACDKSDKHTTRYDSYNAELIAK